MSEPMTYVVDQPQFELMCLRVPEIVDAFGRVDKVFRDIGMENVDFVVLVPIGEEGAIIHIQFKPEFNRSDEVLDRIEQVLSDTPVRLYRSIPTYLDIESEAVARMIHAGGELYKKICRVLDVAEDLFSDPHAIAIRGRVELVGEEGPAKLRIVMNPLVYHQETAERMVEEARKILGEEVDLRVEPCSQQS